MVNVKLENKTRFFEFGVAGFFGSSLSVRQAVLVNLSKKLIFGMPGIPEIFEFKICLSDSELKRSGL